MILSSSVSRRRNASMLAWGTSRMLNGKSSQYNTALGDEPTEDKNLSFRRREMCAMRVRSYARSTYVLSILRLQEAQEALLHVRILRVLQDVTERVDHQLHLFSLLQKFPAVPRCVLLDSGRPPEISF